MLIAIAIGSVVVCTVIFVAGMLLAPEFLGIGTKQDSPSDGPNKEEKNG